MPLLSETHAVHTYAEFAESNKERLQSLAAPKVAKEYYESPDLYVFDEFQTQRTKGSRRVVVNTLYDTVCAIRDDEAEHVYTMRQCQNPKVGDDFPGRLLATVSVLHEMLGRQSCAHPTLKLPSWRYLWRALWLLHCWLPLRRQLLPS